MEFTVTLEVTNRNYSKKMYFLWGFGLVLCVVVLLTELFLNGNFSWLFLALLLCLICGGGRIKTRTAVRDVRATIEEKQGFVTLIFYNVLQDKGKEYSRKYVIDKRRPCVLDWNEEASALEIRCSGTTSLIDETNRTAAEKAFQDEVVCLYISRDIEGRIRGYWSDKTR